MGKRNSFHRLRRGDSAHKPAAAETICNLRQQVRQLELAAENKDKKLVALERNLEREKRSTVAQGRISNGYLAQISSLKGDIAQLQGKNWQFQNRIANLELMLREKKERESQLVEYIRGFVDLSKGALIIPVIHLLVRRYREWRERRGKRFRLIRLPWWRLAKLVRTIQLRGKRCEACGAQGEVIGHHKIFRSHGGPSIAYNCQLKCRKCETQYHQDRAWIPELIGRGG